MRTIRTCPSTQLNPESSRTRLRRTLSRLAPLSLLLAAGACGAVDGRDPESYELTDAGALEDKALPFASYQAESRTAQSGCTVDTKHSGYTGSGFVDFGGNGTWIEWNNISVPAAGNYELRFRYAVAANSRPCNILINGVDVGNVPFASTAAWTSWGTVAITKALKAGNNTIRVLASTSSGGPNLDKLELVIDDSCPNDPNKTTPGMCGCGTADVDSDGNGTLDCLETSDERGNYLQEDCRDLGSLKGDSTVPYYRLRVEYVSSSNWSTLKFAEPQKVYKVRTMSTSGVATGDKALAEYDGITVNQTSSSANAGKKITVTADYALRPAAINAPLLLQLGKGTIGSSTIRISTVVNGSARLIQEVTLTRGSQIQVDLSSLKGVSPTNAPIAKVRRMAWALYYPWYTLSQWDSSQLKDKPQYPYDSSDPIAIKRQITQAKSAGIDGFISSWWGEGSKTDRNMAVVLDVASQNDFQIGMFLETNAIIKANNKNWTLVEDELVRWLEFYITEHGGHPAAMKVDGKPLIVPWVTCTVPVETWKNVRRRMKAHNLEATIIADCSAPEYFDVFDGAVGGDANTGRIIRYHALLADSPSPKIWMSNAMPGYDERLVEGRVNPRYYDREDGEYFKRELNTALQANPQWIRLYTWNEYPENTYIEPSKNFGDKYVKIAAEYVLPWKCAK